MTELQTQKEIEMKKNAELLKALAHPARLKIIANLYPDKRLNVREIVNILQMPQSTVSQHLAKMKGNIVGHDRKGLEVYYYISNPKVVQIHRILA